MKYPSSTSYAAVAKGNDNRFALPDEYIHILQAKVDESLNTRENSDKTRWEENIEAVNKVFSSFNKAVQSYDGMVFNASQLADERSDSMGNLLRSYNVVMEIGLPKMEDILQNFVIGWSEMNLKYLLAGPDYLSTIIKRSPKELYKPSWREAITIGLAERCAKIVVAMDNLEKVQIAYHDDIPLLNYSATPNGRYDSFYIRALFNGDEYLLKMYCSTETNVSSRCMRISRSENDLQDCVHSCV